MAKMHPFWRLIPPPCPGGEQIINGTFETGGFLPWVADDGEVAIDNENAHSGTYCIRMIQQYGQPSLKQTFDTPIPVACIKSLTLWAKIGFTTGTPPELRVGYSNLTESVHSIEGPVTYQKYDFTPYLSVGKQVSYIKLIHVLWDRYFYFDDVSLIGAG